MFSNILTSFGLAAAIRWILMISNYSKIIQNRVEVSTPLNSWKRIKEGAFLYDAGINPYTGDVYHENPIVLVTSNFLLKYVPTFIPFLFVIIDLLCAALLYQMAKTVTKKLYNHQQKNLSKLAKDTEELHIKAKDIEDVPSFVAVAYLFNPYSVLNCVGQTTTVWSNILLAGYFYSMAKRKTFLCCLCLALETQRNFYPFALIIPAALQLSEKDEDDIDGSTTFKWSDLFKVILKFAVTLFALNYVASYVTNDWSFIDSTYGFILNHRDLQPNIGLFWYFFTEMFEHFRTLFLYTFQLNATILYLIPLTIKFHKQPFFLATILTALGAIFRSYPCIGDVGFYLALFPLWKQSSKLMGNSFIIFCFFLITTALGPTVWYLWIYCNSANANFYFGATLGFASAQIFLVTDLLFAANKREFCLRNGIDRLNQLLLE